MSTSYREDMPFAPPTDRVPDDELLRQAAAGGTQAFAELYRRRQPDVFRFALHMTGSVSTAEDIVQDVFLAVIREGARYEAARATVAAWLCGIARNLVRQRLERDRRLTPLGADEESGPPSGANQPADALSGLLRAERIDVVRRAVRALPLPYREAVVLCDLQELPYDEAAEALGCPVGTVRSRLHRARVMLAARLAALGVASSASATSAPAAAPATGRGWSGQVGATSLGSS